LKEIGKSAFYECVIKSIGIPSNAEVIGEFCFSGCNSLCGVTFEAGSKLKEIGRSAFHATGVDRLEIPAHCEILTGLSLDGLKSVTISKGNKSFILRDDFVMNLSGTALIRYFGGDERIVIKSCVEIISEGCFLHCKPVCEVSFESGSNLKEIGKLAFYCMCAIKSIQIPSNVEVIGEYCFFLCQSLCEVTFESGSKLKEIGKSAFTDRLESVKLPMRFAVAYPWPNCSIEYYGQAVAAEINT
jgi:hypothetical protein